jgi:hypothetical protein
MQASEAHHDRWAQGASACAAAIRPDLEQDDFSSNHHPALLLCWSMIFSENRYPLFGIML